ncbi:sensor histidine kinase [Streptomyces sp. WMMB 322]|uniref:sensor histidine kinase n=1 Tax=Streptomyces sp. WMMB 322 TaxID=1286821 RepID=UPI0006E249BE|nr:sensor histidine kinase [Streptomyces sp. WMMB 322]SCK28079.1 Signal transduction histidine kinase [Streptomyces sp. WMMB 322]
MPAIRPTRTDAILAAATFCLVAAAAATSHAAPARAALAYGFALGLGVLILCCRRWPVPVLLVTAAGILGYYVADLPPVGLAAPIAAVLYVSAERGRVGPAAVVGGSLLAVSIPARLIEGDDPSVVVGLELGSEAVLMVAVVALGDTVRNRRSLRAEMARQATAAVEDRHREAARQVEAERLRIAREVHDTLGHTMSVITLQSAVGEEALADDRPESAKAALAAIHSAGGSAMAELRATLGTLRSDSGTREPAPGFDRLPELVDGVRAGGLPVDLLVTGESGGLPAVVGTTAYRVVQEALTNVLRHARATRVTVTVRITPARLSLEVVDDGRGISRDARARDEGQGLRGMSERVALLGGTVESGNAGPGGAGSGGAGSGGFRVHACLPLPRGEA